MAGSRETVAVVGAGPSGLVACKSLAEHGVPYVAYEAGERVGGQWLLGNSSGTSAAYRSLTVNTHKGMCCYADFPLPDAYPDFPDHAQMAAWFESYAEHFALWPQIRLGTRVTQALPRDGGGWELELDGRERVAHRALVVATGNLWDPRWPELPGGFAGEQLHAKDYMDPADPVDCRGKRVTVIGLGNTACEIAVELSRDVASQVYLAARSGQNIVPRMVSAVPHPSEPLTGLLSWLPRPLRNAVFRRVFPRVLAKMLAPLPTPQSLGLPPPPSEPFQKRMVMNDHLFDQLRGGKITPKPGVRALDDNKIVFEDGSREESDVLIAATGYRFRLPFLSEEVLGSRAEDLVLYRGVVHPRHHDLFVIGVMKAVCSIWPRSEQQMAFVAPLLAGRYSLPRQREIERESYPILGVPFSNCQFYTHDLRKELARGMRRAS